MNLCARGFTAAMTVAVLSAVAFPSAMAASARCGNPPSVTLDIGHSPKRPGAISSRGKTEYEFNRSLALELATALRTVSFEVSIVNENGREISLRNRAYQLRAIDTGIILSLHHDSVQPIYLKPGIVAGKPVRYSRHARGYSLFVSGRSAAFEASEELGLSIGSELRMAGFTPSLHHAEPIEGEARPIVDAERGLFRFDRLAVLEAPRVPVVLFEAGVIVNPEEEADLESPAWKERLVRAVVKGIADFCIGAPIPSSGSDP